MNLPTDHGSLPIVHTRMIYSDLHRVDRLTESSAIISRMHFNTMLDNDSLLC